MKHYKSTYKQLTAIGINHWKAPVSVREKYRFTDEKRAAFLNKVSELGYTDVIPLSTCNRSEILAFCCQSDELRDLFIQQNDGTAEQFSKYGFTLYDRQAAEHFFKVAVGLDAQIIGDLQIIKQVKEAYEFSHRHGMVDRVLHRFIQNVFKAHKRSRRETGLATGAATSAYAAVQYARHHLKSLEDKNIVLVGTGKIGKVTCKNLMSFGARNITLVNRSKHRAKQLGERFELPVAGLNDLGELIADADVVIVATGADSPIINAEAVPECLNGKPRILLDLSVPRNIDPALDEHPGIKVVNMDMLEDKMDEAYQKRREYIPAVEAIIQEELAGFQHWLEEQQVVPTIKALDAKLEHIRRNELTRFQNRNNDVDQNKVEQLTRRITQKILAHSINHIKENRNNPEKVTRMIASMFKLDKDILTDP